MISFSPESWKKFELSVTVLLLIAFLKVGVDLVDLSNEHNVRVTELGQFLLDFGVPPDKLGIIIYKAGHIMIAISLCLMLLIFFNIIHDIALAITHRLK